MMLLMELKIELLGKNAEHSDAFLVFVCVGVVVTVIHPIQYGHFQRHSSELPPRHVIHFLSLPKPQKQSSQEKNNHSTHNNQQHTHTLSTKVESNCIRTISVYKCSG